MLDEAMKYELGYMGKFLREYEPRVNFHSVINDIFTKPVEFRPEIGAVITKEVQFPDVSFYQKNVNYEIMSGDPQNKIPVGRGFASPIP